LNTAVIDVKEVEGDVYLYGAQLDGEDVFVRAVSEFAKYLIYLKDRGIYTIARIVVFKDNRLAKMRPEWAVKSSSHLPKAIEMGFDENIWVDNFGHAWADPYNEKVWDYNIDVASRAIQMGFQGVQFDYIRFPSDGLTKFCRYSVRRTTESTINALANFLERAHQRLNPMGAEISMDVFGLAGSYDNDLGIGQRLSRLLDHVDAVSPMMYPSHYGAGEFGIEDPNSAPFEVVDRSVRDTLKMLEGKNVQLRPFLQDFSLGVKYTEELVRAQIEAVTGNNVNEWLLWNPRCRYTKNALIPAK